MKLQYQICAKAQLFEIFQHGFAIAFLVAFYDKPILVYVTETNYYHHKSLGLSRPEYFQVSPQCYSHTVPHWEYNNEDNSLKEIIVPQCLFHFEILLKSCFVPNRKQCRNQTEVFYAFFLQSQLFQLQDCKDLMFCVTTTSVDFPFHIVTSV